MLLGHGLRAKTFVRKGEGQVGLGASQPVRAQR